MDKEWNKEEYYQYAKNMFDPSRANDKPEMLSGVRVLELAVYWNGPMVGSFLAEMGAEVIKFELPPNARPELPMGGDLMRYYDPKVKRDSIMSFFVSRNKYHVTLDVAHPKGKEIFCELAGRSDTDVVFENMRAGGMDKLDLGYKHLSKLNPKLIYLSTNGPGQWGPLADMVSYDTAAQAMAGFCYTTGFPEDDPQYPGVPTMVGNAIGDTVGALWGYSAILGALFYRERTGKGQYIEYSQIDGLLRLFDIGPELYSIVGQIRERFGNRHNMQCPYNIMRCKDGFVILGCDDRQFPRLCEALGRPELASDPRYINNTTRLQNQTTLYHIIEQWALTKTKEELYQLAVEYSFVYAPVLNAKEICEHPHFLERGSIAEVDDPYYGKMKVATHPTHFSETPARIRTVCKPVGADNSYIYGKYLGMTEKELQQLRQERVI